MHCLKMDSNRLTFLHSDVPLIFKDMTSYEFSKKLSRHNITLYHLSLFIHMNADITQSLGEMISSFCNYFIMSIIKHNTAHCEHMHIEILNNTKNYKSLQY